MKETAELAHLSGIDIPFDVKDVPGIISARHAEICLGATSGDSVESRAVTKSGKMTRQK